MSLQLRFYPDSFFKAKPPAVRDLPEHLRADFLTDYCLMAFGHVDHVRQDKRRGGWVVYTYQPRSRWIRNVARRRRPVLLSDYRAVMSAKSS